MFCKLANTSIPPDYRVCPPNGKRKTYKIFCKKCDKFHVEFINIDENTALQGKAKLVGFMREHELECLGKGPDEINDNSAEVDVNVN